MGIETVCQCGYRFKARDSAAGEMARCGGCGYAVRVPMPGEAPTTLATPRPAAPAPPAAVKPDRQIELLERIASRLFWLVVLAVIPYVGAGVWLVGTVLRGAAAEPPGVSKPFDSEP